MERSALKNLLTSLCANSPWKYAVFWKLKDILLTWEDGYCDYTKRKKSFKGKPDPAYSSEHSKILSSGHPPSISDRSSVDFSIGFAIGYMSCLQYALGEGFIGRAALTGDDRFVFFQNSVYGEFCSSKPEFPEEWNLQVTAGIETILLVPLLPHGVLQLGSFDKVDEDLSVVSVVKDIFNSSLYKGSLLQYAMPDNAVWRMLPSEMQFEYPEIISSDKVVNDHISNYSVPSSPSAVQNRPEAITSDLPVFLEQSSESDLSNSSIDSLNLSDIVGQLTNTDAQATMCDILSFAYMDEVINCSLLYGENDDDIGFSGVTSDAIANFYLHEDVIEEPREEPRIVSDDIYSSPTVAGTLFGFPVDCELLRGFETCFPEENDHISWNFCEPNYFGCVSPTYLCNNEDLISNFDPSPWEYSGYFDERNHEDPLQDVVPSMFEPSEVVLSSMSSITSLVKNASSSPALSLSEEVAEVSAPATHELMSFFIGADDFHYSMNQAPSTKSGISMLTEEKKRKRRSHGPPEIGVKQTAGSKKARTNNGRKPRPKDRQLIQDRLKELRDLVPKGEKCSIDSLLEKAIKHMQFLTGVTEQAEKMRCAVDKEAVRSAINTLNIKLRPPDGSTPRPFGVLEDENGDSEVDINCSSNSTQISPPSPAPLPRENGEGRWRLILAGEKPIETNNQEGCSSAVQDLKLYPVTVKDLSRPGSMLIEMVCHEEHLFFEITKVLSHLGLTILKSIMESNSGKNPSVKFVVEAPRGFSKMEIFFPLMQLLQRRRNTAV